MDIRNNKNNSTQGKYICPMHANVVSGKPRKCSKCGGMKLVKVGDSKSKEDRFSYSHHDHASMMATLEATADLLKRFLL